MSVNITCPKCAKVFETPVVLSCGHTFCYTCACQLINAGTDDEPGQCLLCRFPIAETKQDLEAHEDMAMRVDALRASDPAGYALTDVVPLEGVEISSREIARGSFGAGM